MTLRRALSIFALALAVPLTAVGQGCSGEEATSSSEDITQLSDYAMDIDAANEIWPDEVPIVEPADAWTALVRVGDQTIPAPTHLFGSTINIIPYSDDDGVEDATGAAFERGDQEIAKVFQPGQLGIALKMHRPEKRIVDLNSADAANMKEDFKLQDTHIGIVVGVEQAEHGAAGAITLNNPQTYQDGHWGDKKYSMIFLRPELPGYAVERKADYDKNMIAALVGFNAVSDFPGDYNGGDPLGAKDAEKLQEYVDQMVRAIAGDEQAKAWFEEDAQQIYCAELAFVSLSAGLLTPLTRSHMEARVGAEVWASFVAQVELHNRGVDEFQETGSVSDENTSNFLRFNDNKRVGMVRIDLPADDLRPVTELAPNPAEEAGKMALMPMTMSDIVREFMRTHIPREVLGEQLAPVQGAVLAKMKPGLFEAMAMDKLPDEDPRKQAVNQLFDQIVEVVSTPFPDYQQFQAAIEPLMEQARMVTGPRPGDESGTGLFVPPSLYHVVAQNHHGGGLMTMQYEGHGVHVSAVRKKAVEQNDEPTPVEDIASEVSCAWIAAEGSNNSCGGQAPGGCWCDSYCVQAGDCCNDAAPVCGL